MGSIPCDRNLCSYWAAQRFNNGICIDDSTLSTWLNDTENGIELPIQSSEQYMAWGIAVEVLLLLCYSFCIWFYYVRLKAKTWMRLVTKDYLEFASIFIGCATENSVSVLKLIKLVAYYESGDPLNKFSLENELLLAIADFSFIMNNVSAAFSLISFSFKVASGFGKAHQEKFKYLFMSVNFLCLSMAAASIVGFSLNLSQDLLSHDCQTTYSYLHKSCPWEFISAPYFFAPWLRIVCVSIAIVFNMLAIYIALRNFDFTASSKRDRKHRLIEGEVTTTFGRGRRVRVFASALFTLISWLLLLFAVLLTQRISSTEITQPNCQLFNSNNDPTTSCNQSDSTGGACVCCLNTKFLVNQRFHNHPSLNITQICQDPMFAFAAIIFLSPASAIIRALAYPISSILATLSFETGANKKKKLNLQSLHTQVVYKDNGAASYRLNNESRFSADDWETPSSS